MHYFFKELLIQITAYFLLCYLTFLLVICSYSLYNLDINVINIANHFYPQSTICLVNYLCYLFFYLLHLMRPVYQYINLFLHCFWVSHSITKYFPTLKIMCTCMCKILYFPDAVRIFIFLLMLRSLIHLPFFLL